MNRDWNTVTVRPSKRRVDGEVTDRNGGSTARELNSGEVEIKVEESDEEGDDQSKRAPKKIADPRMPTSAEVEDHNLTHLPYRSWCVHCVRGRGEQTSHRRQGPRPESAIPEIHMDYCFVGRKDEDAQPIFVARDPDTRMTVSYLVQNKGVVSDHTIPARNRAQR